MITNQVVRNAIEELNRITKVNLAVYELNGKLVAGAGVKEEYSMEAELIAGFADSQADSQVIKEKHLLKVYDDEELQYILLASGPVESVYTISRVAVSQLTQLIQAYKERLDRNHFFQNLILDNLLLVDIYNRAKKLHLNMEQKRVILLVETDKEKDTLVTEFLKGMFSEQAGDYITAVDETSVIIIKSLDDEDELDEVNQIACSVVDNINSELMINARIAYGTIVHELKDISKSYKEATVALNVGKIFYAENNVNAYSKLGIGRLIYQLPVSLCKMFITEIFGEGNSVDLDEEELHTIQKFFENNLNVSETARQLFIHRNTLVYRIEKIQKATGLDIRIFDDALTLQIALMVVKSLTNQTQE